MLQKRIDDQPTISREMVREAQEILHRHLKDVGLKQTEQRDVILHTDTSFSLGFWKPTRGFRFGGQSGTAFGTPGVGGSFGFADPAAGLGFAYAPNRMGFRIWDDAREKCLRDAVYHCPTERSCATIERRR